MVFLSNITSGRNNNLNLIRMIAAVAVLVSHAYPISQGTGTIQPLMLQVGHSLGGLAVYVFFAISGFLIANSYSRSRTRSRFIIARVLRLYPGLIVSLLFVGFVLGPIVTMLSPSAYLLDSGPYIFMVKNLLLVTPQYTLPGVFETLPYPTIEGSIWTIFYEVVCYCGIFVVGLMGILKNRIIMTGFIVCYLGIWCATISFQPDISYHVKTIIEMSLPFAMGVMFYLWQDSLPMSIIGCVVVTIVAWLLRDNAFFDLALVLALSYVTFWLAYVPRTWLLSYNKVGDYSYGIYVYAFPIQGLVMWLLGPMSPIQNIVISLPITFVLSILSWHIIERPALGMRDAIEIRIHPSKI